MKLVVRSIRDCLLLALSALHIAGCAGEAPQVPNQRLAVERPLVTISWPILVSDAGGSAPPTQLLDNVIHANTDCVFDCRIALSDQQKRPRLVVSVVGPLGTQSGSRKRTGNFNPTRITDHVAYYQSTAVTLRDEGEFDVQISKLAPDGEKLLSIVRLKVLPPKENKAVAR